MTLNSLNEPIQIKIIKVRQQLIQFGCFYCFLCSNWPLDSKKMGFHLCDLKNNVKSAFKKIDFTLIV